MNDQKRPPKLAPQTRQAQGGVGAPHLHEGGAADKDTGGRDRDSVDRLNRVDRMERDAVTSGIAQTSEVADRDAQEHAGGLGDGPPLPR